MKKLVSRFSESLLGPLMAIGLGPAAVAAGVFLWQSHAALNVSAEQSEASLRTAVEGRLQSLAFEKKTALESYLTTLGDQIAALADNRAVIDSMRVLDESGHDLLDGLSDEEIDKHRSDLRGYYGGPFETEYQKRNGRPSSVGGALGQLDDEAVVLQDAYINDNPNPLGQKHRMDRAKGDAAYHAAHAKYHPGFRAYLERFHLYDIFFVDADHNAVIYSVYKEVDFATSLTSGPWAQSGLARAHQRARSAAPGSYVYVDFSSYAPSYDAPAAFLGAPVYDDGELLGTIIFQVPVEPVMSVVAIDADEGETGDAYLVGPDHLLRSNSTRVPERTMQAGFSDPEKNRVSNELIEAALGGEAKLGTTTAFDGTEMISAVAPVAFGDVRWALALEVPTAEAFAPIAEMKAMNKKAEMQLLIAVGGVFALTIFAVSWYAQRMRAPIQKVLDTIEVAARGDLTSTLSIDSRDEIGRMAARFGELMRSLRDSLGSIKEQGGALKASSAGLTNVAGDIAGQITQMNEKTRTVSASTNGMSKEISAVAAAVEEFSTNIENVAAAVEEMSTNLSAVSENMESMVGNVNAVAGAVSGMSDSLGSVEQGSSQAAEIASRAAGAAEQTNRTMQKLGDAAQQIGKVIGVINDIAEQTNLLALNATIEAASAGEAGRGFAVVASEVKELAKQTAAATEEIRTRIADMQESTKGSVSAIQEIVTVIGQISAISTEITGAVAKQRESVAKVSDEVTTAARAARVVNENVRECSKGASEVARNAEELSKASNEIARSSGGLSSGASSIVEDMSEISERVQQTAGGAGRVDEAARELHQLAERLDSLVATFHV